MGAPPLACLKTALRSRLSGNLPWACPLNLPLCCSLCCDCSSVGICRRDGAGRRPPPTLVASLLTGLSSVLQGPKELHLCLACTSVQSKALWSNALASLNRL